MKPRIIIPLLFVISFISFTKAQDKLTASELLEKSISYHDPNNQWGTFNGSFTIKTESDSSTPARLSEITINQPENYFKLDVTRNGQKITYEFDNETCSVFLNGSNEFSKEEAKTYRLNCETGSFYKNYYTYLYGLPMKLKDPGTKINPVVTTKKFKGKTYLTLNVSYSSEVGSDLWTFYFNPDTYAMEVYQFLKDGVPNSGEYILLSDIEQIKGMKLPKNRSWYFNSDDAYLAKDILIKKEL